ncbi:hypothetical protein [Ktedonospora formicarum]|uniref:Uncharacterized protein n=1 Tax=Ktedonospora formicarum TaxID=2778364 RepID=A0A8J3MUV4_9CHLR|nr:hypothetical protein [Ktedonospora formicarum]GHO49752.1 hypothetical protein KSX_79150 [Ktedonospora formicarum]
MGADKIFYSSPDESQIIRESDVISVIQRHVGLKVLRGNMTQRSTYEDAPYLADATIASRWFRVSFESPEGPRQSMVLVVLVPSGLHVATYEPPLLVRFNQALRHQIKDTAEGVMREYIEALEEVALAGWLHCKDAPHSDASTASHFRQAYFRVGFFLPDSNTDKELQKQLQRTDEE